jgi:hypothetical protein
MQCFPVEEMHPAQPQVKDKQEGKEIREQQQVRQTCMYMAKEAMQVATDGRSQDAD